MKAPSEIILRTAAGAMEISWVYALAAFFMDAVSGQPYPLPEAAALFAAAAAVTAFTRGRGWRHIQIGLLHGAAVAAVGLRGVYAFWYRSEIFWSQVWLADFLSRSRAPHDWFTLAVFSGWTIVFWISGARFGRRAAVYPEISVRFDKGLTWLFGLLLLKMFMRIQMGLPTTESVSETLIFPFFIFGLLAVALSRSRGESARTFLSGYRGLGLIISFSSAVLFCGTGLVLFFATYLQAASESGYEVLKSAGKFFGPILVRILMIFFGYRANQPATAPTAPPKIPVEKLPEGEPSVWATLFFKVAIWVFGVVLALMVLFLAGIGGYYLWRWLFSRGEPTPRSAGRGWLIQWLEGFLGHLQRLWARVGAGKKRPESLRLYGALLRWGKRSGLPYRRSETPLEYGRRLKGKFQPMSAEIDRIIALFNLHVYGQAGCGALEAAGARQALKRLSRPALWPRRFKLWFLSTE